MSDLWTPRRLSDPVLGSRVFLAQRVHWSDTINAMINQWTFQAEQPLLSGLSSCATLPPSLSFARRSPDSKPEDEDEQKWMLQTTIKWDCSIVDWLLRSRPCFKGWGDDCVLPMITVTRRS